MVRPHRGHAQAFRPQVQRRSPLTTSLNSWTLEDRCFQKIPAPGRGSRHHGTEASHRACPVEAENLCKWLPTPPELGGLLQHAGTGGRFLIPQPWHLPHLPVALMTESHLSLKCRLHLTAISLRPAAEFGFSSQRVSPAPTGKVMLTPEGCPSVFSLL